MHQVILLVTVNYRSVTEVKKLPKHKNHVKFCWIKPENITTAV